MPEMEGEFEIYYFAGYKYWRCNQKWSTGSPCGWSTRDYQELLDHVAHYPHSEEPQRKRVKPKRISPILGPNGEEIHVEIEDAKFREEK